MDSFVAVHFIRSNGPHYPDSPPTYSRQRLRTQTPLLENSTTHARLQQIDSRQGSSKSIPRQGATSLTSPPHPYALYEISLACTSHTAISVSSYPPSTPPVLSNHVNIQIAAPPSSPCKLCLGSNFLAACWVQVHESWTSYYNQLTIVPPTDWPQVSYSFSRWPILIYSFGILWWFFCVRMLRKWSFLLSIIWNTYSLVWL